MAALLVSDKRSPTLGAPASCAISCLAFELKVSSWEKHYSENFVGKTLFEEIIKNFPFRG
ncbi:hypothetical protein DBT_1776 [Dissulfuribacter thermophilus]|uniref:Uncharacterized protein n=1 Tax=Dissulfuribacter thermophilus TaxID=1156395 RepID=A0A1B9F457_9BACT|nr:hypothetical protein DBT_1776 [Dissulfuribacter thermophilus]